MLHLKSIILLAARMLATFQLLVYCFDLNICHMEKLDWEQFVKINYHFKGLIMHSRPRNPVWICYMYKRWTYVTLVCYFSFITLLPDLVNSNITDQFISSGVFYMDSLSSPKLETSVMYQISWFQRSLNFDSKEMETVEYDYPFYQKVQSNDISTLLNNYPGCSDVDILKKFSMSISQQVSINWANFFLSSL